ncbi:hypothetical protein J5N97_020390 [Dioscorea zingiberensis]|uniref:Kinesin motor domain-containing protein n=1 Tax=Dioscorea zingiberensis TaxID=325984 RepID=A0A9D5CFS1_9LILI|nr:hypothetical protein J5N97_020390 [Dioscorea zingiberensis]
MSSRNQNKPPRSPSNKKENALDEAPLDKRRKIVVGKMVAPSTNLRGRSVLSAVNAGPNLGHGADRKTAAVVGSDGGSSGGGIEFTSREDVDRLLSEKMKGKNKNDYKGKSEQMIEYIRKLRTCIKWYVDLEDGYLSELEKLRGTVESQENRHTEIEAQMRNREEELNETVEQLQAQLASSQESFQKEETLKLDAIKSYEKEAEARIASEALRASLSEDLERANQEAKRSNDQIKMLQETNRRLQEYNTSLQQYNSNLQSDAVKNGETISKLQKEKNAMMDSLTGLRDHSNSLKNQLDSSRTSLQDALKQKEDLKKEVYFLRSELQQVRDHCEYQLAQVQALTSEIANYKELTGKSSKELDNIMAKTDALEETCSSQRVQIQSLQHQLAAANEKLKMADLTANETMSEFLQQKKTVKDLQNRVAEQEIQILEAEKLKGAIVSYPTSTEFLGRGIDLMHHAQQYSFTFDKVFNHEASQEDVFVEISQLVQSALDGYKVCIFAYGQTGSGKTYTMMGRPEANEEKGLIPRSLEQIFQTSQALQCQGWKYKMQASMLEIYNETIRDLLSPIRPGSNFDSNAKQYAIKHDVNGNTHVSDLTIIDVCSINEVSFLLQQAAQSRSVGRTQMNEQSSRSHFVFTLRISGVNESTEQQVQGILNLIDLAGSERLAKSGSTGDRLKETQKEDHVPFRNSKLTYLLQPCLGGDSKTLMFVNIAPEAASVQESICSLRFAARVNSCEIGIPRRQTQTRTSDSRLSYG